MRSAFLGDIDNSVTRLLDNSMARSIELLHKHEIDGCDEAKESCEVVPVKAFASESNYGEEGEDDECDNFLNNLQLHQCVGASVAFESDAVGGHLETVFKESESPGNENDNVKRCVGLKHAHVLKFQMAVPGENHKDVAHDEQSNGENVLHLFGGYKVSVIRGFDCSMLRFFDALIARTFVLTFL